MNFTAFHGSEHVIGVDHDEEIRLATGEDPTDPSLELEIASARKLLGKRRVGLKEIYSDDRQAYIMAKSDIGF